MKSGLEDRNNKQAVDWADGYTPGLNEVRPGRPEQLENHFVDWGQAAKVSMKSGLEDRNNHRHEGQQPRGRTVSMKSGLEDRNNYRRENSPEPPELVSMKSGLEDRNNDLGSDLVEYFYDMSQ